MRSSQTTGGVTYTFPNYQYNLAGALTSETLPSGRVIATSYDAANRPVTLQGSLNGNITNYIGNPGGSNSASPATWIQYWPSGSPLAFTRGNGLSYSAEYNGRLQQIESFETLNYPSVTAGNAAANMLFVSCPQWGYGSVAVIVQVCPASAASGDNGNLLGYSEYVPAPTGGAFLSFSQTGVGQSAINYDGVNRLTGIADSGGWSRQFGYDAFGNMTVTASSGISASVDMPGPTTSYNASNQLAARPYDAAGNLLSVVGGTIAVTYDAENRQVSAGSGAYGYDGSGRRVTKSLGGGVTTYVYDTAGELTAEYNTLAQPTPACTTCYLSYDHLGSVRLVTDTSTPPHVVSRHDYLPFGEEIINGQAGRSVGLGFGDSDSVSQRFTAKERDSESGLDYFGARYYGGALGRFSSPDWSAIPSATPYANLANPQSLNLYAYVGNNPLGRADMDGHYYGEAPNPIQNALDWERLHPFDCHCRLLEAEGPFGGGTTGGAGSSGSWGPGPSSQPGSSPSPAVAGPVHASRSTVVTVPGSAASVATVNADVQTTLATADGGALVPLTGATSPYGTVGTIAGYEVGGSYGLVGTTYNYNIWGLYATPESQGLFNLVNEMKSTAQLAGAERISILGTHIVNQGLLSPRMASLAGRVGLSLESAGDAAIFLIGLIP